MTGGETGANRPGDGPGLADEFERRAAERVVELAGDHDGAGAGAVGDPTLDLDTFAAMFDFFRASSRVIGDLEAEVYRPSGLSTAGFRVLFTVWVYGSLEPRQIAQLSGVSRAAVTGVVATLERDGHVTKTRRRDDRRLVTVEPTDAGRVVLAETYRRQNRHEQELFSVLSPDELRAFTTILRKLLHRR